MSIIETVAIVLTGATIGICLGRVIDRELWAVPVLLLASALALVLIFLV
jgi:hypothetical protein